MNGRYISQFLYLKSRTFFSGIDDLLGLSSNNTGGDGVNMSDFMLNNTGPGALGTASDTMGNGATGTLSPSSL
jgi:hypothetical protein